MPKCTLQVQLLQTWMDMVYSHLQRRQNSSTSFRCEALLLTSCIVWYCIILLCVCSVSHKKCKALSKFFGVSQILYYNNNNNNNITIPFYSFQCIKVKYLTPGNSLKTVCNLCIKQPQSQFVNQKKHIKLFAIYRLLQAP